MHLTAPPAPAAVRTRARAARLRCAAALPSGSHTQLGSSRKQNEDRWVSSTLQLAGGLTAEYHGVFDGHGGFAASEWLAGNLGPLLAASFIPQNPPAGLEAAFLQADDVLLAPQGFLGMGARGIGGPKCAPGQWSTAACPHLTLSPRRCGSTGLAVLLYTDAAGARQLLCANVGDAPLVHVAPSGTATKLSVDHVPDDEVERVRIESRNPNPKKPLVRFVGSCWRVGGLLALSRAFGDAHLKASGEFEGFGGANDDYSSGFGVIATPHVVVMPVPAEGGWLVLSSDGLYDNDVRGGGGGLQLAEVGEFVASNAGAEPAALARQLAAYALEKGSTDDITVTLLRLPAA